VLKYLHANGCPWGNFVCEEAVMNGHLDLLKWAIDNGCPYNVNAKTKKALQRLGLA